MTIGVDHLVGEDTLDQQLAESESAMHQVALN
jgi:hypothetical protein